MIARDPTPLPSRRRRLVRSFTRTTAALLVTIVGAGLVAWGVAMSPLPWLAPIVVGAPLFAFGLVGMEVDDRRRRR